MRGHTADIRAVIEMILIAGTRTLHKGHMVAQMLQIAPQHIKDDERAGVANVEEVVDRGAAAVERDPSLLQGDEGFLFARQIIVQR